ncbi:hypothetical protein MGA3_17637 (plasmid) [Bacillus methanolicus MGA3]|nr:hypothetical protein MGA3_17637 [Bacillus methanolicus MGA3]
MSVFKPQEKNGHIGQAVSNIVYQDVLKTPVNRGRKGISIRSEGRQTDVKHDRRRTSHV